MISELVTAVIEAAQAIRASDIYILPREAGYQIYLRGFQKRQLWREISTATGEQLLTYLKFHADMVVSERRRPQVGSLAWKTIEMPIDLRLSTVGDFSGRESLVVRLIYPYDTLQATYLVAGQSQQLSALSRQRGLILFAGPTGSGKTTAMYAMATQLAGDPVVLSIEDPVEIRESQFIQLQVNAAAGMTYEALIKVGLRHRPDIFIIGEIRDALTAQAAIRASLSGHLVLSTVHAKNAQGTVTRLRELGVAEAVLRQALTAACYQRLIPRQHREPAVLFDIVTETELFRQSNQMTERWRQDLEKAQLTGAISSQVAQRFREG
ncbi:competence type IV pilus ATPase ComGA [Levilactobacillus humaensis]|uniref:competence type IV pilus ATPase ComGA n=1 Tax=Levilactobacillus humaensis TaxID=2950375 RepID=UPI0021C38CD2|nr:competence type IV pilus ATPase ComGA [Levilactobacillus humaensis]